MVTGLVQAFAASSGLAILRGYAEYASTYADPLILSGFLNTTNCVVSEPGQAIDGNGVAQFRSINRQNPVTAVEKSGANYHSFNYPKLAKAKSVRATAFSSVYTSGEIDGGNIIGTTEANIGLSTYEFDRFTGVNGSSIEYGANGYIAMQTNAHRIAMDTARQKAFFDMIENNHDIKTDGDGEGITGTNTTFANDCPRAPLAQNIDLSATNTASKAEKYDALNNELLKAIAATPGGLPGFDRSTTKIPYLFLPETAYNTYRRIINPQVIEQPFYKNVMNVAPGDNLTGSQIYFDAFNIRFVKFPDWFFKTTTTTTADDTWKCYILTSSAIKMFFDEVRIADMILYQGESIFVRPEITMMMNEIVPNFYGILQSGSRADELVNIEANKYGRAPSPLLMKNVYKAYWDRVPAYDAANAMNYNFFTRMNTCLLRAQPQYIQAWNIEKALV